MKTELSFDENGYLIPYEEIETKMETLKKYFVDTFPNSETRKLIFKNYEKFITDFQYEIFPHFEQWIGGSFVSLKEDPNDIDVVTFINYQIVELRGDKKMDRFWKFSLEDKLIDSYIVNEYPVNHKLFDRYMEMKKLKHKLFSTTRNEKIKKGYLKLIFTK